jgi:hypothetical protein
MRAVLGFLLIGIGLYVSYMVLSGNVSNLFSGSSSEKLVPPVQNAGISDNTATVPTQTGSGGISIRSGLTALGHSLGYQGNDRYASRGGMN